MAEYTTNYNLEKQQSNEYISIEGLNGNFDKIDEAVSNVATRVIGVETNGVPANGGDADTVGGHTVEINVPPDAKFTDTVYIHPNDANTRHVTDAEKVTWNAKAPMASPTFIGTAKTTANTNYTTSQIRNISLGTTIPSSLANGELYFMYE